MSKSEEEVAGEHGGALIDFLTEGLSSSSH